MTCSWENVFKRVLRAQTKHTGKSNRCTREIQGKYSQSVCQRDELHHSEQHVSQSDWPARRMFLIPAVADSSAADSIKSVSWFLYRVRLCKTEASNPIVAFHIYYEWNYLFKIHSVVLIFAGFLLSEGLWCCIQPPPMSKLIGELAVWSWPMGVLGGFSLSLCPPLAFTSLKKRQVSIHWSWLVVSQVLAGGDGDVKVAAAAGWKFEERTSIFFFFSQSKCVRECSTLI